ncbi:MAG: anaerobic ribonucleoside-triphosphate reductase activating protein [Muribaculaceae bacterium]|nr:anaerobic ribonucleoside-triphosphate reductase activating protein [Muribaculaceae bacterium]
MNNVANFFQIMDIIRGTTVDGPGFRTAIYMAGCSHACPGCQNPQSWDFNAGHTMTLEEIMEIVREEDFDVTLTGGDPLCNPEATETLTRAIKESGYGIWLYTGFTLEEIEADDKLKKAIKNVDTIVEGPYVESLRDPDLPFRGSSNQRIIHLR